MQSPTQADIEAKALDMVKEAATTLYQEAQKIAPQVWRTIQEKG